MKRLIDLFASCYKISKNLAEESSIDKIFLATKTFLIIFILKFFKREFVFQIFFKNKKFDFVVNDRMDLAVLEETFVKREYEFNYFPKPKVIVDLGANVGDTAIFYSILFPEAKIFSVEPNPAVWEKLEKNTEKFPNIKICKYAVSDKTGKIDLYFGDSHLGSSIKSREQNKNSVEVEVYSLEDFYKKENLEKISEKIDILKFDIEGAEEFLLGSAFLKKNVLQIAGEIHDDLTSVPMLEKLEKLNLKNKEIKTLSKTRYIIFGQIP